MSSFSGRSSRKCSAAQTHAADEARQSVALVRAKNFRNHGAMIGWVASSTPAATTASHTTRVWYRVYGPESAPQITALATRPKRIRSAKTNRGSNGPNSAVYSIFGVSGLTVQDQNISAGGTLTQFGFYILNGFGNASLVAGQRSDPAQLSLGVPVRRRRRCWV